MSAGVNRVPVGGYRELTADAALALGRSVCPSMPLDLGIAYATSVLIENGSGAGIKPCESCDGSPGHTYPDPTIAFRGSAGAAWHAVGIVLDFGLPVLDLCQVWSIGPVGPDGPPTWHLRFRPEVRGGLVTPPMDEWVAAALRGDT